MPQKLWDANDIKQLRTAMGLTQEIFGERLGLSARRVSDLETGYRETSWPVQRLLNNLERRHRNALRRVKEGVAEM